MSELLKICKEMLVVLEQVDFSNCPVDYDSCPWKKWEETISSHEHNRNCKKSC